MIVKGNIEIIEGTMCNVYVFKLNDKIIQVDAGMKGSAKKIIDYYQKRNLRPDVVLITHYHIDHIGSLGIIKEKYNPEIYANKLEIPVIEGKSSMGRPKSLGARIMFSFMKPDKVSGIKPLEDLKIEGLKILETPGHTPGSTSFIVEKENSVFIGDAASSVNGTLQINEKYTMNMEKAKESLNKIRSLSPILVLPGHGEPLQI